MVACFWGQDSSKWVRSQKAESGDEKNAVMVLQQFWQDMEQFSKDGGVSDVAKEELIGQFDPESDYAARRIVGK